MRIYGFIASEKTTYPVRLLCRVLGVSASAFYDWVAHGSLPSAQQRRDADRIEVLRQAWAEHRQVYGARRLTAELRDRGMIINRKAVARLMRLAGIQGIHRRRAGKRRQRASSAMAPAPDLVQRRFVADVPERLWVADITYLLSWEGFLYLAVVVDACSRRVVGWAMADRRRLPPGLLGAGPPCQWFCRPALTHSGRPPGSGPHAQWPARPHSTTGSVSSRRRSWLLNRVTYRLPSRRLWPASRPAAAAHPGAALPHRHGRRPAAPA
jgi:hypothetical protein